VTKNKSKYNKTKFFISFAILVTLLASISHIWHLSPLKDNPAITQEIQQVNNALQRYEDSLPDSTACHYEESEEYIDEEIEEETDEETDDSSVLAIENQNLPDSKVFVSPKVWSYPHCFNDSNSTQLKAAVNNGISPMKTRQQLHDYIHQMQLTNINTSPYYVVEDLTHSIPYLVPKAQLLLNTIGINFVDSLQSKKLPLHLPIVTSVLRTAEDIQSLQRGNLNSVTNSCHSYGTTIDITYNRFMPINSHTPTRYDDTLKKVLAEVLFDLKEQGRCYVKYERLQACFHLTVI